MTHDDPEGARGDALTELDQSTSSTSMEHLLEHVVLAELMQEA
jgi:hypothetical protein